MVAAKMSPMSAIRPNRTKIAVAVLLCVFLGVYLHFGRSDAPVVKADPAAPREHIANVMPALTHSFNKKDLNSPSVSMDDPRLVAWLRDKFLLPPPPPGVGLNLSHPWLYDTSMGQAALILEILKYQRDGFFVECGALDGETRSNTLVFERLHNWTGLLVEADPLNYEAAVRKRRRSYLSQTCLSIQPHAAVVSFKQAANQGRISLDPAGRSRPGHVDVQCFPLYTYLLALNRTRVDYFSLDVEGNELEVLETVPFDKLDIRTLSVEFIHGSRGKQQLRTYMEGKGYDVYDEVTHFDNLANDFIFVKKSLGDR